MLDKFQAAFEALPDGANSEDIIDFLAGVAVSFMPPNEAMRALLQATRRVAEYAQDVGDIADPECTCPRCTERRAAQMKH